ncbi:MAG: Phosphatidylglycerol/phosphatidylinositol transfer protein [Trizodia sp. TS-e1964]|nr:MAG: Phosphatidylglycerol/phosphatidylinositol transfer protein [Trizodia sp. TS-e1964]
MLSTPLLSLLFAALTSAVSISGGQQVLKMGDDGLSVPGENPLKYCETPHDWVLDIEKVDLSPNPPEAAKNLTITASGTLKEAIAKGAYALLTIRYGYIQLLKQTVDLCEQVGHLDLECPIKAGKMEIVKVVTLPSTIPPVSAPFPPATTSFFSMLMLPQGKYKVHADVFNFDNKQITCLEATVEFP